MLGTKGMASALIGFVVAARHRGSEPRLVIGRAGVRRGS